MFQKEKKFTKLNFNIPLKEVGYSYMKTMFLYKAAIRTVDTGFLVICNITFIVCMPCFYYYFFVCLALQGNKDIYVVFLDFLQKGNKMKIKKITNISKLQSNNSRNIGK